MKTSKKLLCGLLAGVLTVGSVSGLAACGDRQVNAGAIEAYNGSEITVTFYHTMGANLQNVLNKYIPKFNEMYPNITIEHSTMGDYPALRDQIATELTGGNSPSIAYCYPDHVALYNKARAVLTLDDYIASEELVTKADGTTEKMGFSQAQIDDFIDAYYEEGKAYGDNKMYTLPYTKSTEVLYYNKTYFAENNLTVPTTWEEMENVCKQIKDIESAKENNNVIPLGYDSESNWFITMTEQLGTPYTSATGDHFLFNTAENRAFVEKFRGWYEKGYVTTEEISGGYTSDLFTATGASDLKCYMCIGSSAGASYQCPDLADKYDADGNPVLDDNDQPVQDYPFEVGVAQIPQVNASNPKVIQQGPSLCLFKKSNSQEMAAAWLFAKFLTTTVELQAEVSMTNGYTPVIESVQDNSVYASFLAQADGNQYLQASCVKQTLAQMSAYYVSPAFNGSSAARDEVGVLLQNCFLKAPAAGQSVAAFIEAQFKTSINTLEYDYGF
ncbi:MAG: extracellular solute-binding protein [Clostridia bacterium]|nr:extracellular solute-binding protein [Clostridia bacterium]